jgi:hypothetical protein
MDPCACSCVRALSLRRRRGGKGVVGRARRRGRRGTECRAAAAAQDGRGRRALSPHGGGHLRLPSLRSGRGCAAGRPPAFWCGADRPERRRCAGRARRPESGRRRERAAVLGPPPRPALAPCAGPTPGPGRPFRLNALHAGRGRAPGPATAGLASVATPVPPPVRRGLFPLRAAIALHARSRFLLLHAPYPISTPQPCRPSSTRPS